MCIKELNIFYKTEKSAENKTKLLSNLWVNLKLLSDQRKYKSKDQQNQLHKSVIV